MANALRFLFVVGAFLGIPLPLMAQPRSGQELVDFVRDAHRGSREAIRTCSCRVERTITTIDPKSNSPNTDSASGRFWYSPDAVRAQVSEQGSEIDYVWTDSVRQCVSRPSSGGKAWTSALRDTITDRHISLCDPWAQGLLVLNRPGTLRYLPFEEFETVTRLKNAKWRTIDGKEMVVIELFFDATGNGLPPWDIELYFDPSVNYLVRRSVYSTTDGKLRRETEVTDFKECAPGVFFPERIAGRTGNGGKFFSHHVTMISDIRVNQALPENIFQFRYPEGIWLADAVRNVGYRVDSQGHPISPEEPLERRGIPPPTAGEKLPSGPYTETQEEPKSAFRWVLPVSVSVLVVGLVAAFVRRWRRPAE